MRIASARTWVLSENMTPAKSLVRTSGVTGLYLRSWYVGVGWWLSTETILPLLVTRSAYMCTLAFSEPLVQEGNERRMYGNDAFICRMFLTVKTVYVRERCKHRGLMMAYLYRFGWFIDALSIGLCSAGWQEIRWLTNLKSFGRKRSLPNRAFSDICLEGLKYSVPAEIRTNLSGILW
jgi:hypothetical protein